MTWQEVSLASVCKSIRYGYTASASEDQVGPKFLRITDIVPECLDWDSVPYCEASEKDQSRFSLELGDIVVARTGATVGYAKRIRDVRKAVFASYLVRFRVDSGLAAPDFVGCLVESTTFKRYVKSQVAGAAQPNANAKVLGRFVFKLPPRSIQCRVAAILSAYDDLIENNRRRIALLEEAARLLYREWFVHFRFPGHEQVRIVDGLPEGWGRSVPSGIIANHIGGGWGKDQPQGKEGEPAFVIRGTDIPRVESGDISSVGLRFHGATSLLSRVLVPYDVVFEVSGGSSSQPIARTLLLTEERLKLWNSDVICASFCKRFTFRTAADALYFIFHIREHRDRGDVLVYQKESASSLKNFNFDGFMSSYEFPVPPTPLRKLFFESIDPIVRHQSVLAAQIQQLTQARDLLLPRLMNGEIAV